MGLFGNPRNLKDSYCLVLNLLRLAGLFPFEFDAIKLKFHVSWKGLSFTLLHLVVYAYVNVTSIMESWVDFAQPMLGHSSLTAFGNLVLRLMSILITFLIMVPTLLGSLKHATAYNKFQQVVEELQLLGIDVDLVYRRIYYMSCFGTVVLSGMLAFTAWHSIFFYECITQKPPELKFYLVVIMSMSYRILFIFYGNMQFFGIYMISQQLNNFLAELRNRCRERCESERKAKWAEKSRGAKVDLMEF